MTASHPKVVITDEALRDGLQIERLGVTLEEKLKLIDMLVAAGVKRLVVGAFVNPKWSPQMADTTELVKRLKPRQGVEYFALALNDRGREIRREFSPPLSIDPMPTTLLHLCEVFLLRNTNRRMEDQERTWRAPIEQARAAGAREAAMGLSSGWGSNWRGEFTQEHRIAALDRQYEAWTEAGIKVVRIDMADPMAWNTPAASPAICAPSRRDIRRCGNFACTSQCPRHGDAVGLRGGEDLGAGDTLMLERRSAASAAVPTAATARPPA